MDSFNDQPTATVYQQIIREARKVIVGQEEMLKELIIAFLSSGHVLLEGVPGIAKTLMVKTLAHIIECSFERIQFTPDMMPSDVLGTHIFDMKSGQFHLKKGPVFTNFLLADEINRTPPKTQSALLEAMEENQATIEGEKIPLGDLFVVFATQNPVEFEGTYPLPEAQMDRFMFKVLVNYPGTDQEKEILKKYHQGFNPKKMEEISFEKINYTDFISKCREEIKSVTIEEKIFDYIININNSTRKNVNVSLGASPRGAISLLMAGKTRAALSGRNYVVPDDIKESACAVLRHRIVLKPESEIEGITPDEVIKGILSRVEVPR